VIRIHHQQQQQQQHSFIMASIFAGLFRTSSSKKKDERNEDDEEQEDDDEEEEPMTQLVHDHPIHNIHNNAAVDSPLQQQSQSHSENEQGSETKNKKNAAKDSKRGGEQEEMEEDALHQDDDDGSETADEEDLFADAVAHDDDNDPQLETQQGMITIAVPRATAAAAAEADPLPLLHENETAIDPLMDVVVPLEAAAHDPPRETAAAAKTPPPSDEQQHHEHVQFRSGAFYSADEAAAALAVQPPEMNLNGIRSLSRVFTVLPAGLPSYQQMVADNLEFLCYILLLETMSDRLLKTKQDYEAAVRHFASLPQGQERLKTPGRLRSRCLLAALAVDLYLVQRDDGDGSEHIRAPTSMSADDWKYIREKMVEVKGTLLQKNANVPMGMIAPPGSAAADPQLAQHPMMTLDLEHVLQLLDVQRQLASFRGNLQRVAHFGRGFSKNNKAVEQTVNEYMRNLARLFPVAATTAAANEDDDSDADDLFDDDNDDDMDTSQRSVTANIPKELISLLPTTLTTPEFVE